MKEWINAHRQALLLVLKKLRAAPLANLMMAGVIGAALSLPAGLYLLIDNLHRAVGMIETEPQVTLFLALDTPAEGIRSLEQRLRAHPDVRDFRFLERDAAWRELQDMASLPDGCPVAKVLMQLARLPAGTLESVVAAVIEQPEKAAGRLASLAT